MNKLTYKTTKKSISLKTIFFALFLISAFKGYAQLPGKIHIGLIYPLSSNGTHAPLDTNNLSIHLLAGVSAAERGLSFAGFSNFIIKDAMGSQFAGFSNHIGGKANGTHFAGFMNTYGGGKGGAFAGFSNISHNDIKGAQFSGFLNYAKNVKGAQFAGFLNYANGIKGAQFAGFINIATKNVSESQIAGFINIAKKVKGTQIAGFINIADSSDYPIGIINMVKNGEKSIGIATDETQTTLLSFRSGGKALYGIIGVGYNFKNADEVYAAELGVGAHFFPSNVFSLNSELVAIALESFKPGEYFKTSFRLLPTVKLFKTIGFFGGPSLNFVTTTTLEGKQLHTSNLKNWTNKRYNNYDVVYIGYTAGLHILF